jgi:PAS domain S-box-containing protein
MKSVDKRHPEKGKNLPRERPEPEPDFKALFESAPDPCLVLDRHLHITAINDAYLRATMTKREEIIGHQLFEVFPDNPDDPKANGVSMLSNSLQRVLKDRVTDVMAVQKYDIRRPLAQGGGFEERYWSPINTPVYGADGEVIHIIHRVQDVTEVTRLKQMEEQSLAEKLRLASFPMLNPHPIMELDADGKVTYCNPAAEELLMNAKTDANPFLPADLPAVLQELKESDACLSQEVQINGSTFEETICLTPRLDTLRIYTMDITKRKRAQQERERALLQLESVLESINEGVVICDLNGNVVLMNQAALSLHGLESDEQARRPMSEYSEQFELFDLEGASISIEQWPLMRAFRGEQFVDYEVQVRHKESGKTWIGSYSGTPVRQEASAEMILAVITIRDITDRKQMEEQITALNASLAARVSELEEANQELSAFNHMVSHDLRRPLNTMGVSCQAINMMCGDKLDESCKEYVRIAYNNVFTMNNLIESLLQFSSSMHAELRSEIVNLSELAQAVLAELKLSEPSRRVSFHIAENLTVSGDSNLLRSVLENLIGNAWKYTGNREEAVIDIGKTDEGREIFFVRDNGTGFDMAEADHLFTPFKRLTTAEGYKGFGIGLATVARIIRRHGGTVWAEGEKGKGATFYFTLPAE